MTINESFILGLEKIPFTRVYYKSRFNSANRTPRQTWCYGKSQSDVVTYRGLNFQAEKMPKWLQDMADRCSKIVIELKGFNPGYNSCIVGKYVGGNDQIGFHFDTETFLAHHCCVNLTIFFMFEGLEHALPKRARTPKDAVRYSISFRNMKNDIGIGNSYYYCRGLAGAIDDEMKIQYQKELASMQNK